MQTNVLHLIPSFHQGGSEQQGVQLVKLLHADGTHRVHVACLEMKGVLLTEIENIGFADIPEFRLNSFYDANMIRQLWRCRKFLLENNIDIVQTHDFYTNIFGMTAASIARVRVRIAAKRETGIRSNAQRFIERRAFGLADAIVVNAEGVRKYLVESGVPASKISVMHNAVEPEKSEIATRDRNEILAELGLPTGDSIRFVTIVANLRNPVKNQRMFLRAASIVKTSSSRSRFCHCRRRRTIRCDENVCCGARPYGRRLFFGPLLEDIGTFINLRYLLFDFRVRRVFKFYS